MGELTALLAGFGAGMGQGENREGTGWGKVAEDKGRRKGGGMTRFTINNLLMLADLCLGRCVVC